jgi:hypothetical protein
LAVAAISASTALKLALFTPLKPASAKSLSVRVLLMVVGALLTLV